MFPVARDISDARREAILEESVEVKGSVKYVTVEAPSELAMASVGAEPYLSYNHF